MGRRTVLVVNVGTFCDQTLMDVATKPLASGMRVVYITDESHAPAHAHSVHHYHTPSHVTRDVKMRAANSSKSVMAWGMRHPLHAISTLMWVEGLKDQILTAISKHKPAAVIAHYGVLPALLRAPHTRLFDPVVGGVFVLYFAPGVPNATVPWIFDGRLKQGTPAAHARVARASWETVLDRLQARGAPPVLCSLRRMTHVLCWDAQVMPPLKPLFHGICVVRAGSLHQVVTGGDSSSSLVLPPGRRLVLVTFGSFANSKAVPSVAGVVRCLLRHYDAVVLHDTTRDGRFGREVAPDPRVLVVPGWLPHAWIVPRASLVVFTGSLCLQTACLWHKVPMLFVPLLAEQFFWAHNFQAKTGVPFVRKGVGLEACVRALDKRRQAVGAYLTRVATSMRTYHGPTVLKALVTRRVDQLEVAY